MGLSEHGTRLSVFVHTLHVHNLFKFNIFIKAATENHSRMANGLRSLEPRLGVIRSDLKNYLGICLLGVGRDL